MSKTVLEPAPPYDAPPPYISVQPGAHAAVLDSAPELGPKPVLLTCPNCRILVSTRVEMSNTTKTHIFALACCLILCLPCVCLAYCGGAFNNVAHYCPNCDTLIGTYQLECYPQTPTRTTRIH